MSVLDDLRRLQDQVVARLQELEPLVSEYQELRQTADRLGLAAAPDQAASSPAPAQADAVEADATPSPARRAGGRRRPSRTGAKRQAGGSSAPAKRQAGGSQAPAKRQSESSSAPAEAPAASSPAPAKRRAAGSSASAKRQPGGSRGPSREAQLLELIAAQPGITVTAAGKQLGVDPTGLYRPVRKLVAEGKVDKQGAALRVAG